MRTYYIVKKVDEGTVYEWEWKAHKRGILSTLGIYSFFNEVQYASSNTSADYCEHKLKKILKKRGIKPKVVRVVRY